MSTHDLMSTRDVARDLQVSRQHVARLVAAEQLKPYLQAPGARGAYMFHPAEVERVKRERLADRPSSPTAGGTD